MAVTVVKQIEASKKERREPVFIPKHWIHIRNRYTIDTVLMQQPEYLDTHEGIAFLPCLTAYTNHNARR